jgi:hypothetical protein
MEHPFLLALAKRPTELNRNSQKVQIRHTFTHVISPENGVERNGTEAVHSREMAMTQVSTLLSSEHVNMKSHGVPDLSDDEEPVHLFKIH